MELEHDGLAAVRVLQHRSDPDRLGQVGRAPRRLAGGCSSCRSHREGCIQSLGGIGGNGGCEGRRCGCSWRRVRRWHPIALGCRLRWQRQPLCRVKRRGRRLCRRGETRSIFGRSLGGSSGGALSGAGRRIVCCRGTRVGAVRQIRCRCERCARWQHRCSSCGCGCKRRSRHTGRDRFAGADAGSRLRGAARCSLRLASGRSGDVCRLRRSGLSGGARGSLGL